MRKIKLSMLEISSRHGFMCKVPEVDEEDNSPKFHIPEQSKLAKDYYLENGYVVIKSFIPSRNCENIIKSFNEEVKASNHLIKRQTSGIIEKNLFSNEGWVMNPILGIHTLNPKHFKSLRSNFDENIVSNNKLASFADFILGEKPKIIGSMYFEGNTSTPEHHDSYYFDDEKIGSMFAGWLALEDISADAGRFFVCPKSHLIDNSKIKNSSNFATKQSDYIQSIVNAISENRYEIRAPKLDAGDLLIWNSLTIHGSLNSTSKINSRNSITFHVIRSSSKLLVRGIQLRNASGEKDKPFEIYREKDQALKINRAFAKIEIVFQPTYLLIKKVGIKVLIIVQQLKNIWNK